MAAAAEQLSAAIEAIGRQPSLTDSIDGSNLSGGGNLGTVKLDGTPDNMAQGFGPVEATPFCLCSKGLFSGW